MSHRAKVLVSGMGLVGPGAANVGAFWKRLDAERAPRPERLTQVAGDGRYIGFPAGDVPGDVPGRLGRLALAAVKEAVADSGLAPAALRGAGVHLGTTHGSIDLFEADPTPGQSLYGVADLVAAHFECGGASKVYSTACSASLNALGLAAEAVADGRTELMVVVGAELCSRIGLAAFERLGGVDGSHCRPFDRHREGAVFGEGAAVLILESERHFVERRGRVAYCTVDGFGWSCDAHHATAPEPAGDAILAAMRDALAEAGCAPSDIGCVLPHGTGTRLNDQVEALALGRLLGAGLASTPVFPLKAYIGHGAGAAGAFSCVAAALICSRREVPPVANCDDPEFELCLPRRRTPLRDLRRVLVNGYAFGGNNASVVLGAAS